MKLSLIIHLHQHNALHWRHLFNTLPQDLDEVFVFHSPDIELPEDLPEHWSIQSTPETESAKIWETGLAQAQGEYIAFFEHVVSLYPHHFASHLEHLEANALDATFSAPQFINTSFLPEDPELPMVSCEDIPGFLLQSRLLWPIENFVFRRSALKNLPFENTEIPRLGALAPWLNQHKVQGLPQKTLEAVFSEHWQAATPKYLKQLLNENSVEDLLPAYAYAEQGAPRKQQAQLFILQSLRNHNATELLQKKGMEYLLHPETIVVSTPEATVPEFFWQVSQQSPTIHVILEDAPSPIKGPLTTYSQNDGIAEVRLYGFTGTKRYSDTYESAELEETVRDLLITYRPQRIHFLSLKPFGANLLSALIKSNYPVYLSVTHSDFTEVREQLRSPETFEAHFSKNPTAYLQVFQERNAQLEHLVQEALAALLVYDESLLNTLRDQGYTQAQYIRQASALQSVYQQAVQLTQPEYPDAFASLYHQRTQHALSQHITEDLSLIDKVARVLCVGQHALPLVNHLTVQKTWAQAVVFDETTAERAQSQGLPAYQGKLNALSPHIHYFDTLHVAYAFETLNAEETRLLIGGIVMALKKGGQLILRGFAPEAHDALNIHPNYRRVLAAETLKQMLEYVGFEILSEQSYDSPLADYRIEAKLKIEAVPQSALPVASPTLETYWQNQVPPLELEDDQRVLLMGTHIYKNWLIYRVQCQYMLGITLNFGEMGKRQKPSEKYHFRHTRHPLKTLQNIKSQYDVLLLQGVFENHTLQDSRTLLQTCHQLLSDKGQLFIQELNTEDLFGHSFLHLRPVRGLRALIEETGFICKRIDTGTHHLFYTLEKTEVPAQTKQRRPLPESVESITLPLWKHFAEKPALQMTYPHVLQAQSHQAIHAHKVLEQLSAGRLDTYCAHLVESLKPEGLLILSGPLQWPEEEGAEPLENLISHDLVSYLLQSHGMRQYTLEITEDYWVWCGFRSVQHIAAPPEKLRIQWHGDLLNYHSLATVNRELLNAWFDPKHTQLSINTYSDPSFEPAAGEAFYGLSQHIYKPLLQGAQMEIAHHWPPNFELPQSSGHWIFIQPWEFGSLPEHWIYQMNKFVDQVWVPSEFVRQSYLDSGLLPEKVAVVPNGVDTDVYSPETPPLILETEKRFKFLYVGGTVIRKGLDLLLKSYFETFTADDDVTLVIKEFGTNQIYQGIDMDATLEMYRNTHDNPPEVLRLNVNLPPEQMPALYNACDAFVHPYRGEGFALPIAEAMACQKPVIVTGFGACLDFCNEENAFLIPAEKFVFEEQKVDDYTTVDYPYWAEPDTDVLSAYLRHVYENPENAQSIAERARETICERFTWQHAALRLDKQIQEVSQRPVFRFYRDHALSQVLEKGFTGIQEENYAPAATFFEKALQIDPYQPSVWYNLGIAYLMLKEYPKSLEALTRSMREGTVTGDLCYAMGTVLRHLGDQKTSQQFFAKAQALNPELFSMSS